MLDIEFIRSHSDLMKQVVTAKNVSVSIDELLDIDTQRRELLGKVEFLRSERNEIAKSMKQMGRLSESQKIALITRGRELKQILAEKEDSLRELESQYKELMYAVPNTYSTDTPLGKDDTENVIIKTVGEVRSFDF